MELRPTYPITTERLRLRPLTNGDIPALLTYRGDPEVCRYLPFEPMDNEALTTRLEGPFARTAIVAEGDALTLGAETIDGGRLIGDVVLFFHSEEHQSGEIGYVFHPDAGGQGYATETCSAMLGLAFGELGLHRVTALMDARNSASARLAGRLGMRAEAHHVRAEMFKGEWADLLIYALLAEEWRPTRLMP